MARPQQRTQTPAAKKVELVKAAPPAPTVAAPQPGEIAARAYALWQQSGCPHGKDQEHWLQAERELRALKTLH